MTETFFDISVGYTRCKKCYGIITDEQLLKEVEHICPELDVFDTLIKDHGL